MLGKIILYLLQKQLTRNKIFIVGEYTRKTRKTRRLLTVEEENKNAKYTAQELRGLDSKVRKVFVIEFLIYHVLFTD
jgi:hypothetical protein